MDRFEYVMVLVSIIIGLGIAHVLVGVGGIIDRNSREAPRLRLSVTYGAWLAFTFSWLIQFWWWEYRFSELDPAWTLGLYLFLVTYAMALFLMAVILVPRSWDGVERLDDFFMQRRGWFYSILIVVTLLDVIDSLLKGGWSYVGDVLGPWTWTFWIVMVAVSAIGLRSRNRRYHLVASLILLFWLQMQAFADLSLLGF